MRPTLRDILFANIDGWYVIPLGLVIGLALVVIPLAFAHAMTLIFGS